TEVLADADGHFTISIGPESGIKTLKACDGLGNETAIDIAVKRSLAQLHEILTDRLEWNNASQNYQDEAIELILKNLAPAYRFVETREFECANLRHRLGIFEHIATQIELILVPGGSYFMGSADIDAEWEFCRQSRSDWRREWCAWESPQH